MNVVPTLPYDHWIEEAMRGVVRRALREVADEGLPGAHHLYVSFITGAPGVSLADDLRARYTEEMTIVLQHQFWDLAADEDRFEVPLKFHGRLHRLVVPYAAVSAFVDPSVNFALQFRPSSTAAGDHAVSAAPALSPAADGGISTDAPGEVITLDRFRKK